MASRSRAREVVFQVLYQDDLNPKHNPAETDAFYYLHANGQIHTARTYQEHLENIEEFLN